MKKQFSTATSESVKSILSATDDPGLIQTILAGLFFVEPKTNPVYFYGRTLVYVIFLFWGWQFILMDFTSNEIGESFMHNVNLVFHEAGHILFRPFGWFITILGGTLGQLLMPVIVILTLILKERNNFTASIGLWWLGQSLMDCAPYINDAREQQLILLGGHTGSDAPGYHDWNNILVWLDQLENAGAYANMADITGALLMICAFAWGGYILYRQYRNMQRIPV